MKISLLLKRENFYKIFKSTIQAFFTHNNNKTLKVSSSSVKGAQKFIVNKHLNIIFPDTISRDSLYPLIREYSWNSSFYKRLLQGLYTFISIRLPFQILFSDKSLFFITDIDMSSYVFIPGNHSIRIIDFSSNSSIVLLKKGSDFNYLLKDAEVRLLFNKINIPKILHIDYDYKYFIEERIIGIPWNRLSDNLCKVDFLNFARLDLSYIYAQTQEELIISSYVKSLIYNINSVLSKYPDGQKKLLLEFTSLIIKRLMLNLNKYVDDCIIICDTHGDFQPANIICSDDKFWLIDWEYSYKRSIFYDALTFFVESRITVGFSLRLSKFMSDLKNGNVFFEWTGANLNYDVFYYLDIFLLEDILLKINEASSSGIHNKVDTLYPYLSEIYDYVKKI